MNTITLLSSQSPQNLAQGQLWRGADPLFFKNPAAVSLREITARVTPTQLVVKRVMVNGTPLPLHTIIDLRQPNLKIDVDIDVS